MSLKLRLDFRMNLLELTKVATCFLRNKSVTNTFSINCKTTHYSLKKGAQQKQHTYWDT